MIKNVKIENYKSINKIDFDIGRINIFIGENGAGKSNILEAIALAGAASARKLDNEFLSSRGIRVTKAQNMRQAFSDESNLEEIVIECSSESGEKETITLNNDNKPYSKWQSQLSHTAGLNKDFAEFIKSVVESKEIPNKHRLAFFKDLSLAIKKMTKDESTTSEKRIKRLAKSDKSNISVTIDSDIIGQHFIESIYKTSEILSYLDDFIIYSPENSSLKTFEKEGQIEPLGINGEGLLKLISVMEANSEVAVLKEIKNSMKVLGWFEDFQLAEEKNNPSNVITVKDRYVHAETSYFDQYSTNEGFLFLLFYFCLFSSKLTPKFFAVDNIDASLNPKLCEQLIKILVKMSVKYDKQVIFTTHNPAILDGLNLDDDDQRLFIVSRARNGNTKIKQVLKPMTDAHKPVRLSEMFIKGMLGGLPRNF